MAFDTEDNYCTVCNTVSNAEFTCRGCKGDIHYICALGFDPPAQLKNTPDKVEYLCPICVAGSSYDLLHLALESHKREWISPSHSDAGSSVSNRPPQHESSHSSADKSHLSSILNGPLDTGQVDLSSSSSTHDGNATTHTRPDS